MNKLEYYKSLLDFTYDELVETLLIEHGELIEIILTNNLIIII